MISDIVTLLTEHGLAAGFLVVICIYHFWWAKMFREEQKSIRENHIEERKEWRRDQKALHKETTTVVRDNNIALRELTKVIAESNEKKKK